MTVAVSLRLGIFRDRPVFEQGGLRGTVVPAHIAAYAGDGLWGFMQGVANASSTQSPNFFYDPMTYWLYLDPQYWARGSEAGRRPMATLPMPADEIRPAFRALLRAYDLLDVVDQR